jgi:hypothetical protein
MKKSMHIDTINQIVLPPIKPCEIGTPKNWEKIEKRLGLQFPPDYKPFVDCYGTGSFDDFIIVYNPFAKNEYLNLFYALDTLHQADRQTQLTCDPGWTAVKPFGLYPATDGLLPWGCTTNLGDSFFWQIKGPPETWETIFYNLRSGEYEVWKHSMSEFLSLLFTRQIESVLLPEDYPPPDGKITFIPTK